MGNISKKMSITSRGLHYKLRIAFCLMSVVPLLTCIYLFFIYSPFISGVPFSQIQITLSVMISIAIAFIGFVVTKQMVDPIIKISSEAKIIARGDLGRIIEVKQDDEVGELGNALNQLTHRIKDNMEELKHFGDRTKEINLEIHRRVIVLSSLLQISSFISQGEKIKEILEVTVEKILQIGDAEIGFLFLSDPQTGALSLNNVYGLDAQRLSGLNLAPNNLLYKIIASREFITIDSKTVPSADTDNFRLTFGLKNAFIVPVISRGKAIGVLGIGNNKKDFVYRSDDLELLDIFAKQVAISIESDFLMHKAQSLEIKDPLTGLFNESYIKSRLDEEIKRAILYQRPCSFILYDVDGFRQYRSQFGDLASEAALKKVAVVLEDSVSEIERAARFGDNQFAIVLPEKNKKQAQEISEDMRKKIEFAFSEESDKSRRLTVSGGLSENPIDGMSAEDLINKARELLKLAKSQGKNQVRF